MDDAIPNSFSIKSWAEEDRPREKLALKGRHSLSDAELIAILLGSGTREESAVRVAQRILHTLDGNLNDLARCTIHDLMKFKGIGEAKAITIAAALELGRRRQASDLKELHKISGSKDAFYALAPHLMDLLHEEFWVLFLNRANRVIGKSQISAGGMAGTVVDARIIFRKALEGNAAHIILAHNHPSGNLRPSQQDIDITKQLRLAGDTIAITVLDHLIIAGKSYYSFSDEGML